MNAPAALPILATSATLPALIDRAVTALSNARSAAEVLEARDLASIAYDIAKKTVRLAKAKQAHDDLIAAAYRAQADALEIEAQAKRRLADEYDAAQERGEVAGVGGFKGNQWSVPNSDAPQPATAAEIGIPRRDIQEARLIRDAENIDPGVVKRTVTEAVEAGEEPTKAKVRRAVLRVVQTDAAPAPRPARGRDAICSRVREAIMALSGLPPASEVVGYFAGTDGAIVINEHLTQAAAWIDEFRSAWGAAGNADQD